MLNLTDINSFPTQDFGSLGLLKEIAQKYCPEEAREVRQSVFPDEALHLEELEADSDSFWLAAAAMASCLTSAIQIPKLRHCPRMTASASESPKRRNCATCTTRRGTR